MLLRHQRIKLIGLAIGILICYSLSAIFKEKVLRRPYDGERFSFAFAFTAAQCIVFVTVAKAVITVRDHPKNETPQRYFCIIGVFYVLSKVTSYMSLRYVPYPTQVVGKSSKPIPVMLLGVLIGRKTYTAYKYIFVTIIVIGVFLFSFKEKYDKKDGEDPILGIIFIGVSLLMDGFLGAFEDRMRSVKKPTPLNLMLFMNSWNSLYLIIYLCTTSEGIEFFQFCHRHPVVIRDISVVVFFGIFGQFCITSMIANFGALPLSITTTIRKFVTVLLSIMIFDNVLSVRQWIAASIIFIALFLDGHFSRKSKSSSKKKNEEGENTKECAENKIENGHDVINNNIANGIENPIVVEENNGEVKNDLHDKMMNKNSHFEEEGILKKNTNRQKTEGGAPKRVRISISEDDASPEKSHQSENTTKEQKSLQDSTKESLVETDEVDLQNEKKSKSEGKSQNSNDILENADLEHELSNHSEESPTNKSTLMEIINESTDDTKL